MRRIRLTLLTLACAAIAHAAENQAVVDWIRANAIKLETPEAGHGFADMQKLKQVVGDARIVSLGEATHGTREFFQLKHRMLEFLATEMGFTIFSIEANMPEAYRLNEYVLTGKGDVRKLLKGMYFWTWDTEEVLAMIEWMRKFNQSGKGRVEFTGFDMQTPNVALEIVREFAAKYDPEYLPTLKTASANAMMAKMDQQPGAYGAARATLPIEGAAERRAHLSGYIKTEGITRGAASLLLRVDGAKEVLAFSSLEKLGLKGTTDWKKYEIDLPVPAGARTINFAATLSGDGTAWFDGFTLEVDGKPYTGADKLDFDFENGAKGFYLQSGNGYDTQTNSEVHHNGGHSLRIKYTRTDRPPTDGVDAKTASATWAQVVHHFEQSRQQYAAKEAKPGDMEWAIQNARVVLQCMQLRAGQVARDESMAQNVKWILDQSPKAKIVLWAHNGHVGADANSLMGGSLRRMYGKQMVVFGFMFNRGSFQAVDPQSGLRDFTVAAAPSGSLDATLAETRLPHLALDLRRVPESGVIADWWNQFHQSRGIGATYSEKSASQYLVRFDVVKRFDALLFVEKTTAARKTGQLPQQVKPVSETSEYHDETTGLKFQEQPGWSIQTATNWGDRETTVALSLANSTAQAALYFKPVDTTQPMSPGQLQTAMRNGSNSKAISRSNSGTVKYRNREDSFQTCKIKEQECLKYVADFEVDGKPMVEYFIRIANSKITAMFFARLPAADLETFREQFDKLAATLTLPIQ